MRRKPLKDEFEPLLFRCLADGTKSERSQTQPRSLRTADGTGFPANG
jgi:hypothetical protein